RAAPDGRELARRARRARAAAAGRRDLCLPAGARADARRLVRPGVRRRDFRRVRPRLVDLRAHARLPGRGRQRRRPAQRRAAGHADPGLAAARDPRPRPSRRLGGGGGPGTGRAGLPEGMSDAGRHTIGRWLRDRARNTPDRTAIDYDGRLVTYRELDDGSDRLAAALAEAGLRRGDRLATLTGNSPE